MISVGIDAAKDKSTVCILNINGEVIRNSYDISHTKEDLDGLVKDLNKLAKDDELRVVMEATGVYHWPVLIYLKSNGFFVSVINPLKMKIFAKNINFRNVKTDEVDATIIATYGTEKWLKLIDYNFKEDKRSDLKRLSRAYEEYQKPKVSLKQHLDLELDKCMPGIKKCFPDDLKLYDFIEHFYHYDNIKKLSKDKFIDKFNTWAKKKNHRFRSYTPVKVYELAKSMIPTVPFDEISKLILLSAVNALRSIDIGINDILSRMHEIASSLPEYKIVMDMQGVGYTLTPLLIAEVGDIRQLNDKKSLVCMTGIDVPPYISGKYVANQRVITKKGNKHLRRHLYLVMNSIAVTKPKTDTAVYDFMNKKKAEHKKIKQVRVAGMRKFLHIYYARVKQEYIRLGIWEKQIS